MRVARPDRKMVLFIVGPTAIGKTRLAIKLAKRLHGEVVSCDSMQVYKGMTIISQAPSKRDMAGVKHHLVGIFNPGREYNVAVFRKQALPAIKSIIKRGKIPIVVGGSGLYMKALIDGLFFAPGADIKFREKMGRFVKRHGWKKLHERLFKIDPQSAATIHPKDTRRVIRSLEIFNSTGRTMTELKAGTKGLKDTHDVKVFGLKAPREKIYSRIDSRVDEMFENGVVAEVKKLSGKRLSMTAAAALGMKEITGYLRGEYDLEHAKDATKMNTRRFAKRQMTWFRPDDRIHWIDVTRNSDSKVIKRIVEGIF